MKSKRISGDWYHEHLPGRDHRIEIADYGKIIAIKLLSKRDDDASWEVPHILRLTKDEAGQLGKWLWDGYVEKLDPIERLAIGCGDEC